jgi:glucokinase
MMGQINGAKMLLAGDIGGTKTSLAVFSTEAGPRELLVEKTYQSLRYESLEAIVEEFLSGLDMTIESACFGVAGPVIGGQARITNLTWVVDEATLKSTFDFSKVGLLNDLESIAYGIPILEPEDIQTLNVGIPIAEGNIAVLAPGTGLGEAFLTYSDGRYHAHASEGSHASFAPQGQMQMELLDYLNRKGYDHVSFERVCSGGLGIPNLYAFLKDTGSQEPAWLSEKLAGSDDPTPIIIGAAQDQERPCELCVAVLDLFVAILGAEAGNLALKVLSTGGIYLGGGIPAHILEQLQKPTFLDAVRNKGRFKEMLGNMPVHVITNAKVGLLGAAAYGLS